MAISTIYRNQAIAELEAFPEEYLPYILQMMRLFRESLELKTAADSFQQGWLEAQRGELSPIATLWDGIDEKRV